MLVHSRSKGDMDQKEKRSYFISWNTHHEKKMQKYLGSLETEPDGESTMDVQMVMR